MPSTPYHTVQVKETKRLLTEIVGNIRYEDDIEKDDLVEFKIEKGTIELLDSPDLNVGNHIIFSYGIVDEINSGIRVCVIKDVEASYEDTLTITIKCRDEGFYTKKGTSNKIHKKKTASQIVKSIAQIHGMQCVVDETTNVYESYPQGNKNYYQFCMELAKNECGSDDQGEHEFYVRGDTMYFVKKDLKKESSRTYTWKGGDGKLKSFHPTYSQEKEGKSNEVLSHGIDKDSGQAFKAATTDKSPTTGEYAVSYNWNAENQGAIAPLKSQEIAKTSKVLATPGDNKDEALNVNKSFLKKSKSKELTADIVLKLDPTLKAGMIVTISGVAKKHSGNWRVINVTQEIGGTSYPTTKLKVDKNGTSKPLNKSASKNSGDVNQTTGAKNGEVKKQVYNYDWDAKRK